MARGAGSGLSGGALPIADGVLIVVSRMKRVLEVDLDNHRICVEPGVTNANVSKAVGPGFFYPPDPSSQIVCSIGGNVAENSGGAHCFKYGFTTNYVTGLEVVLADGELVQIGGMELDHPGYDLLGAFVGSEGTLGVATKVWLRVVPSPETVKTLVAFFDTTRHAGEAVSQIVQAGVVPGRDRDDGREGDRGLRADGPRRLSGRPRRGAAGRARRRRARVRGALRGGRRPSASTAAPTTCAWRATRPSAQLFWKTRKAAFPAMGRISPNYFVQDGVIPRTKLPEVLERIEELGEEYGMIVANVFHAGDGNLHPLVCYDGRNEGEAERAEELSGKILDACLDAGGSITGEHGVGVDKKKHMPKMFDEPDLDAFQRLRCAFDPAGLANPGKVMPTPRLCGEVPGPVPAASARGRGPGGAVLGPMDLERARRARSASTGRPAGPCGPSAAARSSVGRRPGRGRGRPRDGRPGRDRRAQRRRLHGGARRGRAARRRPGRVRRRGPDARARPAARRRRRRDDRRHDRHRRLRARCATATAACATSSSA